MRTDHTEILTVERQGTFTAYRTVRNAAGQVFRLELTVDASSLFDQLGDRAMRSAGRKAREASGAIVVKARFDRKESFTADPSLC